MEDFRSVLGGVIRGYPVESDKLIPDDNKWLNKADTLLIRIQQLNQLSSGISVG
jgi:hypothetical protein